MSRTQMHGTCHAPIVTHPVSWNMSLSHMQQGHGVFHALKFGLDRKQLFNARVQLLCAVAPGRSLDKQSTGKGKRLGEMGFVHHS